MSESNTEDAQVAVMIRTLDAWFLLSPKLTYDAITAWRESIQVHAAKEQEVDVLDATEIDV